MVAGGSVAKRGDVLSSTEALVGLDAAAWTNTRPLPRALRGGSATIGNTFYIAGGQNQDNKICFQCFHPKHSNLDSKTHKISASFN